MLTKLPRSGACRLLMTLLALCLSLAAVPAQAESIPVEVSGINGAMRENVRQHITATWAFNTPLVSSQRRQNYLAEARTRAQEALRPFGYYAPQIAARLDRTTESPGWILKLTIDPGPVVRVERLAVSLTGEGAENPLFIRWRDNWPLQPGAALDQSVWEAEKQSIIEMAHTHGYLKADFTLHRIALDLERNQAALELTLDTGPLALMGRIDYQQDIVLPEILAPISRFSPGDPYHSERVEQLRLDLWKSGYFGDIEVIEQRDFTQDPPIVNFLVKFEPRKRDTHQGTLGFGSDTRFRAQYSWTRHLLSERGDSLGVALGWRQRDSEILASTEYRLPRRVESLQSWLVNTVLRREKQDFIIQDDEGVEVLQVASVQVVDAQLKLGRLRLRSNAWSRKRIAESLFIDLLHEEDSFNRINDVTPGTSASGAINDILEQTVQTISLGMEWDWPVIRGSGFETTGHHERAHWFTANDTWGSDKDFTQIYLSSRWNHLLGDDWKLLLRAEAGYTRASLEEYRLTVDDVQTTLLITELPYRYRFKAGGSQSVRGYSFNDLSNNGIGSNHLLVGSAELEYRLLENWSVAGFIDVGNAFNDWSQPRLKRGWGFGLRWYSKIGALRADLGRAEDIEGKPWEIYLTIGTPLL